MRSDRLLSILLMLQTRNRWSATDLAGRLEVSVRTIYRDVEALSAAGVPVYTERGRNGGIAILPNFRTDVTGMTEEETSALFVALDGAAQAQAGIGKYLQSALRKVFAALPSTHRTAAEAMADKLYLDQSGWGAAGPEPVHFAQLQHAVFEQRRVAFSYEQRDTTDLTHIVADPYGLVSKSGAWYLVADLAGLPRMFRADRLHEVEVLPEPARLRPGTVLREVWTELLEEFNRRIHSVEIVIRLDPAEYGLFLRAHARLLVGTVSRDNPPLAADGSGRVELTVRVQSVGASRVLLAYGAALEVVSPPEVRRYLDSVVDGLIARAEANERRPAPSSGRGSARARRTSTI